MRRSPCLTQGTRKSHPDSQPWTCLQLCFQFYQKLRFLCQTTNFPFFSLQCFWLIYFVKWRRKYCLGVEKLPFLVLIGRPYDVWNKKKQVLNDLKWVTAFCTLTFLPAQADSNEGEMRSRDKALSLVFSTYLVLYKWQLHFIDLRLKEALLLLNHMVNYQSIREELNIILQEKCKHFCRINERHHCSTTQVKHLQVMCFKTARCQKVTREENIVMQMKNTRKLLVFSKKKPSLLLVVISFYYPKCNKLVSF